MTQFGYRSLGFGAGGSRAVIELTADYLIVAGGGGGGGNSNSGGGGGAGGLRRTYSNPCAASVIFTDEVSPITVTIGAGGSGACKCSPPAVHSGTNGGDTTVTTVNTGPGTPETLTVLGGGKGGGCGCHACGAGTPGGSGGGTNLVNIAGSI